MILMRVVDRCMLLKVGVDGVRCRFWCVNKVATLCSALWCMGVRLTF